MNYLLRAFFAFCLLFLQTNITGATPLQPPEKKFNHRLDGQVSFTTKEISSQWWSAAQENIRLAEYQITRVDPNGTYQAPNRAHNFRITFDIQGLHLTSRTNPSTWDWGIRLAAYGYADQLHPVSEPQLQIRDNQITYLREGLHEWYLNTPQGLEQGFTLPHPPTGESSSEIVLEMDLLGTLIPRWDASNNQVEMLSTDGVTTLKFGKLFALDAHEKQLPSRMELHGNTLRLIVQAEDASYPITIDPLATSASWNVEGNQAGATLGHAVASAGDVNGDGYDDVIIGAPFYDGGNTGEGRVFVFHGSNSGLSATAAWSAEGGQDNAYFGYAVASAGDFNGDGYADVLIGAPSYDNTPADEGAAFIWFGSTTGLTCPGGGCPAVPSDADWSVESNQANSDFGFSVATAGDVDRDGYADVIIGAPAYTDNAGTEDNEGWAFLYLGDGIPDNTADWSTDSDQAEAALGHSVASAGDLDGDGYADIIVGAYQFDNGIYTDDGSAFVWLGSSSGPGTTADWATTGGQDYANFGVSVATAGDVNGDGYSDLLIGASGYTATFSGEGRAFIYHGSDTPDTTADWTADSEQGSAAFAVAVASAGDVNGDGYADVIIGSNLYGNGNTAEGAAFTWFGSSTGVNHGVAGTPTNAVWSVEGDQNDAYLGAAVASAGDVNGDGYSDLIVGAPGYDDSTPTVDEGLALAFYGGGYSLAGDITEYDWVQQLNRIDSSFGAAVASAGDVNGDGYRDLIVGAFRYDVTNPGPDDNEGAAFVYYGSATGLSATPDWSVVGNQLGDVFFGNLGSTVASAGDLNGDGYDDIVVGAYYQDNGETDEGMAFVWYGSASGLSCGAGCPVFPTSADWSVESNQADSQFGVSVNSAGDINGDGYSDLLIGARNYNVAALTDAGAAFAWYGSPDGLSCGSGCPVSADAADWQFLGDQANALVGNQVASAGDVNGDGYADIIIGGHQYDSGQNDEGAAFVWYGSATGINDGIDGTTVNADWSAQGDQVGAGFAYTSGMAGDVNGDGYGDIFIGARYYDNGNTDEGAAFVWHGSASGINGGTNGSPGNENWRAEVNQDNAQMTYATSGYAGDINGDGFDDIIVGAQRYSNPESNEGAAFLWLGSINGVNNNIDGSPSNTSWQVESNIVADYLGTAVGTAGDVNGDGYDDAIIGAPRYNGGYAFQGRTYLYYGNASDGLDVLPRQLRADGTADIVPGGQSISPDEVRLSLWVRSPLGRSNVRLQWEAKPLGTAFDGTGLGESAWVDSTITGTTIVTSVNSLDFETRYHWRMRLQAQPLNANDIDLISYQGPWIEGGPFFTALSGEQSISGTGSTNLLGQGAYVDIATLGTLTGLTLRGYPETAHPQEDFNDGGSNMLDRYFSITPNIGASGYNLELCLNYQDTEVPGGFTEDQLRLCRWTGTEWDCPARSSNSDTTNNLVCAEDITGFSDWAIGANLGPTAVKIKHIRAVSAANPLVPILFVGSLGLIATLGLLGWRKHKYNL